MTPNPATLPNLRVLLLEDSSEDAELISAALRAEFAGLTLSLVRNEAQFRAALVEAWDVILSDFRLVQFTGELALHISQKQHPETPFILVSGFVRSETAVALMCLGANDYVSKDDMSRLAPAIRREVKVARASIEHHRYFIRAKRLRRELRRFHLSERERHLAELILDLSFGLRRESIVVPQLQCFTDITGIGKSHVSEGISDLHSMRIIRVITVKGQPQYSIREDSENWQVKPRVSVKTMEASVNLILEWNGLETPSEPLEALANFKNLPLTQKTDNSVPESGTPAEFPLNLELPELF